MILKWLEENNQGRVAEWNYLDKVAFARTYNAPTPDGAQSRLVDVIMEDETTHTYTVNANTFLLNDRGQTIERL